MDSISTPVSFFRFIDVNIKEDIAKLRLRHHGNAAEFDVDFAITQIECRKKFRKKLPHFTSSPETLFPSVLAGEQASHEAVAQFHASLFNGSEKVIDMTAGLGIDAMTIAAKVKSMIACELDTVKAQCLMHNKNAGNISNISVENADSTEIIKSHIDCFDTVFIDPARRAAGNRRVYNFHDCQPDILSIQDFLLENSKRIMIKASPLLDITQTLKDIPSATSVRCICVEGECKEVLIEAIKNGALKLLEAVNLNADGTLISDFSYSPVDEKGEVGYCTAEDLRTGCYLYEPDAAVMKLSPWNALTERFPGIKKLDKSSHLFISDKYFESFPGRKLKYKGVIEKKDRKALKSFPANVVTRNYPLSADELRKKLGVKEGQDKFVYGTRINEKPVLILAER